MATTPKKLYASTPTTASSTLYTVPASTKTIVKSVVIGNTSASDATITLGFGGINLLTSTVVEGNNTKVIDLSLVLEAGEKITGLQSRSNALTIYVSGVEVS